MKTKPGAYFLITIMVVMLAAVILSLQMEFVASKLLPVMIGSIVFVMAGIALWREFLPKEKQAKNNVAMDAVDMPRWRWRSYSIVLGWAAVCLLLIYLAGWIIAIPLFLASYMKSHGVRWRTTVVCAVVMTSAVYGMLAISIPGHELPQGLIFSLLEG